MEKSDLIDLIKAVSASKLTKFKYEENDVKIAMEKECASVVTVAEQPQIIREIPEVDDEVTVEPEGNVMKSPLVGVFYTSPAEGEEPFVSVGDTVKKGQTLAIVEAMKLMNEIESDFDGVIDAVLVENGQAVEYGQPLFRIK